MTPIEIYAMLQRKINEGGYGSPLVASAAENMTDQNRVYVYTGSETGMETGHWYYYDGEDWADGGVYNAVAVQTDKTLTQENKAADGKATGDELAQLKSELSNINGGKVIIPLPTLQNGYYSGAFGSALTFNSNASSRACIVDLSAYIGKSIHIKFSGTTTSSERVTAICDSNGVRNVGTTEGYIFN